MKAIFVLIAISNLFAAVCAAPTKTDKVLANLLEDDNENAEMQFDLHSFVKDVGPSVFKHFADKYEDVQAQEFLANLEKVAREQQDYGDDNKNAEMQFWGPIFKIMGKHLLSHGINYLTGNHENVQAQKAESQQSDDDGTLVDAQFIKELVKSFWKAKAQQSDDDGTLVDAQSLGDILKSIWKAKAQQSDDNDGMSVDDRLVQRVLEKLDTAASEQSNDIMASLEGLPEEVRSQWLQFLPLLHHLTKG